MTDMFFYFNLKTFLSDWTSRQCLDTLPPRLGSARLVLKPLVRAGKILPRYVERTRATTVRYQFRYSLRPNAHHYHLFLKCTLSLEPPQQIVLN